MSIATPATPVPATGGTPGGTRRLRFVERHSPGLTVGSYRVTVKQKVSAPGKVEEETYSTERTFRVAAERFSLAPAQVRAVFPPDGSLGDHSSALPHVVLERDTLPWERSGGTGSGVLPWLAVLLFAQDEAPAPATLTLGQLASPEGFHFPALALEPGQAAGDGVTVIRVKKALLAALLPFAAELKLQAHVRVETLGTTPTGQGAAVLLGSRLPAPGARSVAHLVSVEGRYKDGGFDFGDVADDALVGLVSLYSWSFACADAGRDFAGLLKGLDRTPGTLRLPPSAIAGGTGTEAATRVERGYVLLPHTFRAGGESVAWYRGPLLPAANDHEMDDTIRAADALLRYDAATGVFDVSCAAAWEIGRLLTLQSRDVSVALYRWKRASAHHLRGAEQALLHPGLPLPAGADAPPWAPDGVWDWFGGLRLLQGVPFNYLVPDERMLPPESIRFFHLDPYWIDCLLDGAFSVGRVTAGEAGREASFAEDPSKLLSRAVTGFLLRSEVVSGWPGLVVEGKDGGGGALPALRTERISPGVLLCLFDGDVAEVALHLHPETLHCGLDRNGDDEDDVTTAFHRVLRGSDGTQSGQRVNPVPFRNGGVRRVVDVAALALAIQPEPTSDGFALQMVQGAEEVVFQRG